MKKSFLLLLSYVMLSYRLLAQSTPSLLTPYERSQGKETATYAQLIHYYQQLDQHYDQAKLMVVGKTDVGKPLHVLLLSADNTFTPRPDRVTLLIINGIHPGEPEGIDACMMLARDLLATKNYPKRAAGHPAGI